MSKTMTDEISLCDIDDCEELARYVETGDGHAVRDPKRRCHEHHSNHGLWRDMRVAAREIYTRYE